MKGRSKCHRSTSRRIELSEKICRLYEEGIYSIDACCAAFKVHYVTFQSWAQPRLTDEDIQSGKFRKGFVHEVHVMYIKAIVLNHKNFLEKLRQAVRLGILRKVTGEYYEEQTTYIKLNDNGKPISTTITTKNKYIPPDDTILIFVLNHYGNVLDKTGSISKI